MRISALILTTLGLLSSAEKQEVAAQKTEKIYSFDYTKDPIDEAVEIDTFLTNQDFELEQYLQNISRQDYLADSLQYKNSVTQRSTDFRNNVVHTSYGNIKFTPHTDNTSDASIKYSYAGYAEPISTHLLNVELYEGERTLLVSDDRYKSTIISGFTFFSPDKKYFLTFKDNEGMSSQLSIYHIEKQNFKHFKTLWSENSIVEYAIWDKKGAIVLKLRSIDTGDYLYAKVPNASLASASKRIPAHKQSEAGPHWNGLYTITAKALSNYDKTEIDLLYTISITSQESAILSIGAEHAQDYACEGKYYLTVEDNVLHGTGKCDEDDTHDFYIKLEKGKYFIKSKRFLNQDWQELTKD